MSYKLVFLSLVLLFIVTQWKLSPFVSSEANIAEGILLCAILTVIASQMLMDSSNDMFISVLLTVMVLLPMMLLMYFVLRIMYKEYVRRVVVPQSASSKVSGSGGTGVTAATAVTVQRSPSDIERSRSSSSSEDKVIAVVPMPRIRAESEMTPMIETVSTEKNKVIKLENISESVGMRSVSEIKGNSEVEAATAHVVDGAVEDNTNRMVAFV